jgi:hypothetical protein
MVSRLAQTVVSQGHRHAQRENAPKFGAAEVKFLVLLSLVNAYRLLASSLVRERHARFEKYLWE